MVSGLDVDRTVYYVATAFIRDDEMARRVARHVSDRPASWVTIEGQEELHKKMDEIPVGSTVLLDCITMMITNFMFSLNVDWESMSSEEEELVISKTIDYVDKVLKSIRDRSINAVLVSNEVGMGLVPPYPLGRIFRDVAGWVNQRIAGESDLVYLVTAGIPQILKGEAS